jgi:hypothetical protein
VLASPTAGFYEFLNSFVGDLPAYLALHNPNKGCLHFRRLAKAKIKALFSNSLRLEKVAFLFGWWKKRA